VRRTVAVFLSFLTVALLIVTQAASSDAVGHAGHGGHSVQGHHGFHDGHGGFHDHDGRRFHGRGVIVVGPSFWWDLWWYYPPPYYAYPPPVVQSAPVILEGQSPQSYWYYCPSANAYYPTVPTCPEVWIKVAPGAQ
jgi:hypothetical protein